jgi:predicted AlkP superfamily phosphohydrolase/phosphomutase
MGKLLMIGLDGATFDLIKPGRRKETAAFRRAPPEQHPWDLKSTIPPMSAPAWTSFMTGKNPGKHGIYDFTTRKPYSYEINSSTLAAARRDDLADDERCGQTGVYAVGPLTYPPDKINGIMISGLDTPGMDGVADASGVHPVEIYQEISEKLGGYLISHLNAFDGRQCDEMVEAALQTIERKMETALYLFAKEPWIAL